MRRIPIRIQVAGAFAVAMAVVLAATSWFLYLRLESHLATALDKDLRLRAQDLAALVRDPRSSLSLSGTGHLIESGESYAQLVDLRGRVVQATAALGSSPILRPNELSSAHRRTIFANRSAVPGLDERSRLLATPVRRDGTKLVLVVGTTRENGFETLASFRNELMIAGPIALILASLAGYLLAGVALRPVERMRRRAAEISAETPGQRLPVPETRDEVERLGQTLNEMLGRLEAALARERDFVADAGHELRTPLSLLRTELELALRHAASVEELREAISQSGAEVDRLTQLADDLLLIAGSDSGKLSLRLEPLRAEELLASVARRFEWRAEEEGRSVLIAADSEITVHGDRVRLEQALANLVDNSLRHGAGRVRLHAASIDSVVELHVADEGTGFPPGFIDSAFERFSRPDAARTGGGAGLGLAIVRTIARAHGGEAHAANRDHAGADVWLVLPAG
jgi:two-component system OmpR family sensor kinase